MVGGIIGLRAVGAAVPLIIVGAIAVLGAARAASPISDVAVAKNAAIKSLAAGDPASACAILRPLLPAHEDDLVLHFLVGECLARTGQPRAAIAEYRFILARDPNAIRARASLAAAEAAAGDVAAARRDLDAVLADELPPAVRADLQSLGSGIPPRGSWSAVVTAGAMYDSNPDVGPWANTVTLFGAPFRLIGAPPHPEGDWAALATGSLTYDYAVDVNWGLQATAAANTVVYTKATAFNYDGYSLYAGPSFHTDWIGVTPNIGASVARLGDTLYSVSWGASPDVTMRLSDALGLDEALSVQRNYYYTSNVADGWSLGAISSLQWHFARSGAYVQPKLTLLRQITVNSIYTDNQIGGAVDWFQPLGAGFSLLVEPSLIEIYYRANDPAFGTTRHDETYAFLANVGYELGFHHSQLALGVTITGNRSNQSLYDYNRTQTTLQFKLPL